MDFFFTAFTDHVHILHTSVGANVKSRSCSLPSKGFPRTFKDLFSRQ